MSMPLCGYWHLGDRPSPFRWLPVEPWVEAALVLAAVREMAPMGGAEGLLEPVPEVERHEFCVDSSSSHRCITCSSSHRLRPHSPLPG